jgi:hypothetical protein
MSTAAPVQEVGVSKPGPAPLAPERRERLLFARVMVLLIVPLYALIILTLKVDVRHRIAHVCATFGLDAKQYVRYGLWAYRGLIALVCVATPLYCLLGLARLALGRAGWKHVLAAAVCVAVGIGEAIAIALVVYRYRVSL